MIIYFLGIFAPWVAPYGYNEQDYESIREAPTMQHIAGTDLKGRDVFSRALWGIQNTVIITLVTILTGGLLIGVSLGLISGYYGGKVDSLIMRIGELFASFPDILLVILLAATLRPRILGFVRWIEDNTVLDGIVKSGIADYLVISLALVSFSWVGMARLVRGQVLSLKSSQYVEAAQATGASTSRILFIHLLPNAIGPIVVMVSMGMGTLIGTEIILSWLGLGIQPPRPSLGTMLLEAGSISAFRVVPWMLIAPGVVAWSLVLCWNLFGDAMSDVLNPSTR
ncbi:MAG: peptide/nickel transport system permease protein/oligopeptide transport system permease protein [Chloroflexi bacterium]|jgi:ABC-type dipeptide/oligopeptide/nickel transport system permease subunit|nr:MAG: peptide/nickel transport system permease protein/oligopeptide transport system permease protein [Chloroflexota bacterium]